MHASRVAATWSTWLLAVPVHPCVNAIAYVSIRRLNSTGAVSRWSNLVSGAETLGDKLDLLSSLVIAALAYPRLTLPLTSLSRLLPCPPPCGRASYSGCACQMLIDASSARSKGWHRAQVVRRARVLLQRGEPRGEAATSIAVPPAQASAPPQAPVGIGTFAKAASSLRRRAREAAANLRRREVADLFDSYTAEQREQREGGSASLRLGTGKPSREVEAWRPHSKAPRFISGAGLHRPLLSTFEEVREAMQ